MAVVIENKNNESIIKIELRGNKADLSNLQRGIASMVQAIMESEASSDEDVQVGIYHMMRLQKSLLPNEFQMNV